MQLTLSIGDVHYSVNVKEAFDLSIPVRFDGKGVTAFDAPAPRNEPLKACSFTGNVHQGGSCNCGVYSFIPHTHGTHTEGVGHITDVLVSIHDLLQNALIPATLITVDPVSGGDCKESYIPAFIPIDRLITRAALEYGLKERNPAFFEALVVRTTPNDKDKLSRNYDASGAPFFTTEAIHYIKDIGVKHLLVDIPSIDRMDDEGRLSNHHIFWDVAAGSHASSAKKSSFRTVTELLYADWEIRDGAYLLNLQIAPFVADAAPSRPLLYPLEPL